MVYKRFEVVVIVIAVLLGLVSYSFIWSLYSEYHLVTTTCLFIVWVLLIVLLIRHIGRKNRELARFLASLQFDDTTNLFDMKGIRGSQKKLYDSFNKIILTLRDLKIRTKQEQILLRSTVEQTGAGILVLDPAGKVEICNRAFLDLLGISTFSHFDQLHKMHPLVHKSIRNTKPGKQEMLDFSITDPKSFEPDDRRHLILNVREILIEGQTWSVITIHNIQNEIEQRESDAWEKLLRIFNHEILNSVSPINLLSASLIEMLEKDGEAVRPVKIEPEDIDKALLALKTIKKRGKGLIDFVETYRSVANIPEPVLMDVMVSGFFQNTIDLLTPQLNEHGIFVNFKVSPEDLKIRIDETLLQQAMINIVKNAMEALTWQKDPMIRLEAALYKNRPVISVIDNGPGIVEEKLDKIFTPFFTSRKDGSGIGLSLARQVMKMHHGRISASSTPGKGSKFTLHF